MTWPEGQRVHKETGRRPSTVRRMRDGLKPLVRDFGDRQLDSFSRQEALSWALPRGRHVQQSARQFFNHALDRELIASNVFTRLGAIKRTRRIDRPDFEVISDEQYERLCRCARASRADSYGLILEGVILAIGDAAMRPGEIFALNHSDIDYTAGIIHVRRQLDMASGVTDWPKDDEPRDITMSPKLRSHLQIMPRLTMRSSSPPHAAATCDAAPGPRTGTRCAPPPRCPASSSTNSGTARYRHAVRSHGHFPNDTAALKCLYLVTKALDPTGRGKAR